MTRPVKSNGDGSYVIHKWFLAFMSAVVGFVFLTAGAYVSYRFGAEQIPVLVQGQREIRERLVRMETDIEWIKKELSDSEGVI